MLSPQWLDELRSRVTLSSVIMRTTKLQKAGHEWKACCPFHDEKTPSFTVSDQKGFYHCFGCGAHGDVIRWMTDQRGLQFMDAVKELAAEAGMEVPAPDPRSAQRAEQRAGLHDVMQAAQDWFVRNLASNGGSGARDYLKSRGFNERTVERFGFGYAPAERQAMKAALSDFEEPMLIEGGLRIAVDEKEPYDRFRSRLMLPIHDARGRVIAFGGRILEADTKAPKYLNSPDTPLFDKGRTLYNLHRAGPVSRQSGRMIVVEGYMDVIALAAAGIEDAVAPLGTALTENQIELLWRMVEAPILCFDGDAAGQRAAMRAVTRALPLLRPGKSLELVTLPPGLDPDDLVRKHGAVAFERLLSDTTSLVDAVWEAEVQSATLSTPEGKAHFRERLIERAFAIENSEISKLYRRELVDRYYELIYPDRVQNNGRKTAHGLISADSLRRLKYFVEGGSRNALCNAIFSALARHPKLISEHLERLYKYYPQDEEVLFALNVFFDAAESLIDGLPASDAALEKIASWSNPSEFPFLRDGAPVDYVSRCVKEAIAVLIDRPIIKQKLDEATRAFGQSMSEEDRQLQEYWRKRHDDLLSRMREFRLDAA
ncbi:MAG: DNA primase [Altererythrobacter sp.]